MWNRRKMEVVAIINIKVQLWDNTSPTCSMPNHNKTHHFESTLMESPLKEKGNKINLVSDCVGQEPFKLFLKDANKDLKEWGPPNYSGPGRPRAHPRLIYLYIYKADLFSFPPRSWSF